MVPAGIAERKPVLPGHGIEKDLEYFPVIAGDNQAHEAPRSLNRRN
jgi:hypothetical protein